MSHLTFAANNGSIGGGEVMLLHMATAARTLGVDVRVVGPEDPADLTEAARSAGFPTSTVESASRAGYVRSLRRWDKKRTGVLWCNGLLPALATANHPRRVVHLHQLPLGWQKGAARVARWHSLAVVVPSHFMARSVPGARVLENWTDTIDPARPTTAEPARPQRVGFVGRLSQDKGVDVLARAVSRLLEHRPGSIELALAGDTRFVPPGQVTKVRRAIEMVPGHVYELGWIDPMDLFANVDVVVFPSTWAEPFGLVVAEAMAAEVPFVITDAGALSEVAGADHPWIARAGDSDDLAHAISAALSTGVRHGVVTAAARARWQQKFSPSAGTERLATMLRDLGIGIL